MGDTSLTWYNTSQSTLKKPITLNYAAKNLTDIINVPVKYICLSSKNIYIPKRNFLIQSDEISFEYFNSSTLSVSTNHEYSLNEISSFQYAEKNCLISVTVVNNKFPRTDETLFKNTAWFCLDYKSFKNYSKLLESLLKLDNCGVKFSPISRESLKNFKEIMYKCDSYDQNDFVDDWGKCLLKKMICGTNDIVIQQSNKAPKREQEEFECDFQTISKMKKLEQKYVYCPSPNHSIEITPADLLCLRPKTYINDNIINLYIAYIFHEIMTEKQREYAHFFNCFFNIKLIGNNKHPNIRDTSKIRHERVAKWTKNVDIFDKDFIIIPVTESRHWFLVIVCFPWMAGMVDYSKLLGKSESDSISNIPDNQSEFATKRRHERLAEMKAKDPELDPLPCILVFDSLSFQKRTEKVNIIRDYLQSEWDIKRLAKDGPLIFDRTTVRGYCPKVPQQKNFIDCGVYLLHYLETFFTEPIKSYIVEFFQTFLADWFNQSDVDKKRSFIKNVIEKVIVKSESFSSNDG